MHPLAYVVVGCGLLLFSTVASPDPQGKKPAGGRYVGSDQCKNCHDSAAKGDVHGKWAGGPHAKAYATLATDKAKAIARELGIADPQKSEKCLQCHVTAHGVDVKLVKKSFEPELGVQCESCHGPGETHLKKRLREKMKKVANPAPITADEIRSARSADTCKQCHNEKSPTYRPFCLKERMKEIEHLDPRKARTKAELEKLRSQCTPDCEVCKKGGDGKK